MVNLLTNQESVSWGSLFRKLLAIFILAGGVSVISLVGNGSARAQAVPPDWGSIDVSTDSDGELVVTLENNEIRVVYKQSSNDFAVEVNGRPSCIDEFFVKDLNQDITAGGRFDNQLYQRSMTGAQVIYDGPDQKTVSMMWESGAWEEVSIFRDSRVLQIDYRDWDFLITDWPDWPRGDNTWPEQRIVVHGADQWHRTIDPSDKPTHPDGWAWDPDDPSHFPNDPEAMREWGLGYSEIYYDRLAGDAETQGEIDPSDGGPLNYNGQFIVGAHKVATGIGYGRTLPVSRADAFVLWSYRGWEFVPTGSSRFTSYLYPVTGGAQEILSLGRQLVDGGVPVNDLPVAANDLYVFETGETLAVDASAGVLSNDTDGEGDSLDATLLTDVSYGSLTLDADGSFVYIHDGGESSVDSFTYEANDGNGGVDTATVTLSLSSLRISDGLLVLYNFMEGSNDIVHDVSGVGAALDLNIQDPANVTWIPGGGLAIHADTVLNSAGPAAKIVDGAKATDELTIEAWVNPAITLQFGPARIVALTNDAYPVGGNFILGQGPGSSDVSYDARLRTTSTDEYGTPSLTSPNGSLTLSLTQVVFTRGASGVTNLYLDGALAATGTVGGNFSNWGDYAFGLANEPDPSLGSRPWLGELYLVAVYDNALDPTQVLQNFDAGPSLVPNNPPTAVDDGYTVDEGGSIDTVADVLPGVLDNDNDSDIDPLIATPITDVSHGSLTLNRDGSFVYVHDGGETISDGFTYEANDGNGGTDSATVNININPINDPPDAVDDEYAFRKSETLAVDASAGVLSNDTDDDGDPFDAILLTDVAYGSLTLNADGSFVYIHDGGESSVDSFTYEANDGNGGVDTAIVTLFLAGPRISDGLLVLYSFMEGSDDIVRDVSGVGAALDLNIQDPANVTWIPGGGLAIHADTVLNSAGPAAKIVDGAKATDELTIEAWVNPASTSQFGPARIVALTKDAYPVGGNFILGQGPGSSDVSCDARLRTTSTDEYGTPSLTSPNGSLTLSLTHVVFTRGASGITNLYLDGALAATGTAGGDFSNWGDYALGLANEPDPSLGSRPWLGELYLVAVYDNALDPTQVLQNFDAGPSLVPNNSNCDIDIRGHSPTYIHYVATFDVATGWMSDLRGDGDFSNATCLGTFASSPATDLSPNPPPGEGRYYVARGQQYCVAQGYDSSSQTPGHREDLVGVCP